ncbi:MAG TPA: hypothetical protein VHR45_22770 [Thermoanaerobaculia bacterium]|nr:hypothetical protein [Thermoanaerobaculia bacterium]
MSGRPRTTAERFARLRRDQEAYRRIVLARRSHARFRRDLAVVPHVFLLPGRALMAPLEQPAEAVRLALRGEAVWTLDTAARLVTGRGILVSADLTGYLTERAFGRALADGLIGEPWAGGLSVTPLFRRPLMLIAHLTDEPPAAITLASGDRVVHWSFLIRDILGTLGWRPDLLTRLEAARPTYFIEDERLAASEPP